MTRKVLVSGGAGFIGSHVADAFVGAGYRVTVLDDLSRGQRANVPQAAELLELDLCSRSAQGAIARGGFDVISHHAAQVDVRVSVAEPMRDAKQNVVALLNLLEGARRGRVRRVIFASSGGVVYGEGQPPHPETAAKLPVSPYGVSKLASEYYLCCYAALYGLEVVSLRYSNVYGPRQDPSGEAGVVAIFSGCLSRGEPLTVYGDGSQTRDYVYVSDVARANLLAAEVDLPPADGTVDGRAVNIGTGTATSVTLLAQAMQEAAGIVVPVRHAPPRPGELAANALQVDKARQALRWSSQVGLRDGLKATYEWIASRAVGP